jgi:two-component system, repressor protein LuxO
MSVNNSLLPRVLIIEDSKPLSAFYLTVLAKDNNLDIRQAFTGAEALELINVFAPEIILLDLNLPDMLGMDILRTINNKQLKIITIVMTANGSVNFAVEAMRLGAYDFLEKPIDANRLKITIHNTVEKLELNVLVKQYSTKSDAPGDFIGESAAMQEIYSKLRRIGNSKASVFITGESGTGKEVTALALHNLNTERKGKFVAINCAAIPRELMESEIFGHVKGAFTGASSDRDGAVSAANGGTLFLDELCEMDLDLQSKFLRFLQSSKFQRVGASKTEEVDVRIICATNRNPMQEVKEGRFREDLFYRLFVIPIHLPPLRERDRDVILIAQKFLQHYGKEENKHFKGIATDAEEFLIHYSWPGNVRQLQNIIHRAVVFYDGKLLTRAMLPQEKELRSFGGEATTAKVDNISDVEDSKKSSSKTLELNTLTDIVSLEEMEKNYILAAISVCDGSVTKAASALKVNSSTVYRKLDKWQKEGLIAKNSGYSLIKS